MSLEKIALVTHVLGWVFWLGTDLGVLLSCRYAERGNFSVETRLTLLEVGMLLDRLPRFAVPLVWGSGVILSRQLGYDFVPLSVCLVITAAWVAATYLIIFTPPGGTQFLVGIRLQTLFYGMVIIGMGGGSSWLLLNGEIPLWLALKWYAYVIIAVSALTLEKYFVPVVEDFQLLATEGANENLNSKLSSDLKPVYLSVLIIYGGTVLAGLSGLLKPML